MFSQELQNIFRIENSIADLDAQVDKRLVALHFKTPLWSPSLVVDPLKPQEETHQRPNLRA